MNPFHYSKPADVQAAVALSSATSRFIAGGTNLLDLMKENISHPEHLIDITGLPLREVE
ncbi:molybdopterin dehydrogenase, FAD-binding protein [Pseudomonas mucidolens]|nr:molybdopterin dehydrogenase, FAD-binding protein [Pseudomonas mucidolens]